MANGSFNHVWTDPAGCCRWLTGSGVVAGAVVTILTHSPSMIILDVHFAPPPADQATGYPAEHVRVTIGSDGRIVAVPIADSHNGPCAERPWMHRYSQPTPAELTTPGREFPGSWERLLGALCLWDPHDPPHLRWEWDQGLDEYLRIVQRHLWFEEYGRREGHWPVEDAPHGPPSGGPHHPIKTLSLRSAS